MRLSPGTDPSAAALRSTRPVVAAWEMTSEMPFSTASLASRAVTPEPALAAIAVPTFAAIAPPAPPARPMIAPVPREPRASPTEWMSPCATSFARLINAPAPTMAVGCVFKQRYARQAEVLFSILALKIV